MSWIATDDQGQTGTPGDGYVKKFAGVKKAPGGRYELHVRSVWGSNQGYLEEHGREERKFRADTLDELLAEGLDGIRDDDAFDDPGYRQAIRNCIYEAQDLEQEVIHDDA